MRKHIKDWMGYLSCCYSSQKIPKVHYTTHRRLLLVGPKGSGKCTIINQLRLLYGNGFSDEERLQAVTDIRNNIRSAILAIIAAMFTLIPTVALERSENEEVVKYVKNYKLESNSSYTSKFFDCIEQLWKDRGVQNAFERGNEYELMDCTKYFLDKINEVKQNNYVPSNQDILRCCVPRSTMFETRFEVNELTFDIFRLGSVRYPGHKWIYRLTEITAIIFITACNTYDITVCDNEATHNQLKESLELFRKIWSNNRWWRDVHVILFLNKQDLLEQKIVANKSKLEDHFTDFSLYSLPVEVSNHGNPLATRAKYFIRDKFLDIATQDLNEFRRCYAHFTCAVDTNNVKLVFGNCSDVIERMHIEKYHLL